MRGLSAATVIYLSKYNYFLGNRRVSSRETAQGPNGKTPATSPATTDHASCVQLVVVTDHRNELKAAASVCQSARLSSVGQTVGRTGPDPDRYPRHDEHTSNEISRRHKSPKSTLDAQTQRRRLANWFTVQFMLVSVYARKFIKRNFKD